MRRTGNFWQELRKYNASQSRRERMASYLSPRDKPAPPLDSKTLTALARLKGFIG